ncbi:NUDIX domain-containing protein [Paenisporosarcina quisquiliarum]|uniref:NUDIX hydrolase n=1 Tax=Paenisporosarcina quisquiliarum TaxID=365346 RepID=UPI00373628E2
MRKRSGAIIELDGKIALIKRVRNNHEYYVIPGGGIEEGETPEDAAIREVKEELGIDIEIEKLLTTLTFNNKLQYYFRANYIKGEFGTGDGEEFLQTNIDRGTYTPILVEKDNLRLYDIRPLEILDIIYD